MSTVTKKNKKATSKSNVKVDKTLDKLAKTNLFQEKLDKANKVIKKHGIPNFKASGK